MSELAGVGVVAIGRNEGERLRRCLTSVCGRGMPVVYVDSGSTDGSVELARSMGAEVVELDLAKPFNAARARNAGLARLRESELGLEFVQFVDGDCELNRGWINRAAGVLRTDPNVAAVCGDRRERFPERSIYNRMCDIEWNPPAGDVSSVGGDALMRVAAIMGGGGGCFDESVPMGEEPELCARLRARGHRLVKVDEPMTLHDVAMLRFGQWWRRQVRTGYGSLDVARRFGLAEFARITRSARWWAVGWPVAMVVGVVEGLLLWGWSGAMVGAGAVSLLALQQVARIAVRQWRRGAELRTAVAYAVLTLVAKWAHLAGQIRYFRTHSEEAGALPVDYKRTTAEAVEVR